MVRTQTTALLIGLTALAVLLSGAMAVTGAVGADSPAASPSDQQIAVDATGNADAEPDKAIVSVAVRVTGDDAETLRDDLAAGTSDLQSALDNEGAEYQTTGYTIREARRDQADDADYIGKHAFEVVVDNPDNTGAIVDAAANAGAQITAVDMTLSAETREQLREQAIQNAMDDARQQADTVAAAGDLTVTGVSSVDASQEYFDSFRYEPSAVEDSASGGPPTNVEVGDVSVSYNVDVTFNATD